MLFTFNTSLFIILREYIYSILVNCKHFKLNLSLLFSIDHMTWCKHLSNIRFKKFSDISSRN